MINYFVNDNKECLNFVKNVLLCVGIKMFYYFIRFRKVFEIFVIVFCVVGFIKEENIFCYYFF